MAGLELVHDRTAARAPADGGAPIRILIVDSNPLMRAGLRGALERHADLIVDADVADGQAAMLACRSTELDVVVLDHGASSFGPLETVATLRQQSPALAIIISYVCCTPHEIVQLAQAGAGGFIAKNAEPKEFANAIRAVVNGGSYFSAAISARLMQEFPSSASVNPYGLSAREIDVLRLLVSGYNNKDIARFLSISVRTVESHRLRLRKKANANRLKDLMQLAQQLGVSPTEPPLGATVAVA